MRLGISSALGALLLVVSCGGEDLVLPEDGIPSTIAIVSGNPQNGTVGTALASPLVVRVLDAAGRPVQGQQVTFTVVSGGGSVAPPAPTTGADGQTSTSWTLGASAGGQQVQAKATGGAAPDNLVVLFNAVAGASAAANLVEVSGGGQSATAGSTLADSLIVRVTDAANNAVAGVAVTWTVAGGGSVSDATTVTGADGRTGVRHTLGAVAGAQSATAAVAGLTGSPITFTSTATVGSAGKLVINRQPSATAASGAAFAQQPRIQVQDVNGNNVAEAGRAITAELIGPAGGTLGGATTVSTNAQGLATFANLSITGPAGSYTLNFTGANMTGVTSTAVTLAAGAASKLAIVTQPSTSVQSGVNFPQQPVIRLQDATGNPVAVAGLTVTAVLQPAAGATLGGDASVTTNASGVATFTDLRITGDQQNRTILFASTGLVSVTSTTITVTAGQVSASQSTIARSPSVITASNPGTGGSTITVTARDASGNPVAGQPVTLTAVSGGGAFSAIGPTNASGVATGTYTSTTAGVKTIGASVGGVTLAATVDITVTAGAATAASSTLSVSPGSITAGGTGATATVTARDAFGNLVQGADVTVSMTNGGAAPPAGSTDASGVFTSTLTSATAGTQTVSATVEGDALPTQSVEVTAIATSMSLVSSGSPSTEAQPVTFTATVTGDGATPSGSVSFHDGGSCAAPGPLLATQALSGGVAELTTSALAPSTHTIIACYGGNAIFGASEASVAQVVDPASPGIDGGLSSVEAQSPVLPLQLSAVTVTVRNTANGPVAGATVLLDDGGGGGNLVQPLLPTNADGQAVGTYSHSNPGTYAISATADGIGIQQTASVIVDLPIIPDGG
jgi:adhesin/invasin